MLATSGPVSGFGRAVASIIRVQGRKLGNGRVAAFAARHNENDEATGTTTTLEASPLPNMRSLL